MGGAYSHTFTNPHQQVFHIGCFRVVPGCRCIGAAIEEHSWFSGFRWRVALCGECQVHVGWRFTGSNAPLFHGLILARLTRAVGDL